MRITKSTAIILTSMILLSILLSSLFGSQVFTAKDYKRTNHSDIKDDKEHLIWFIQITDIHISIFRDPFRITQFKEFCDLTINAIKPKVVLASGDLTDAKTSDGIGSEQSEDEWKHYRNVLTETRVKLKTVWLDIRGNHDNFNVASDESNQNFFTNYSVQGKKHPRSYMYQITQDKTIYSFIGIDACLKPGPRRPFNFVGILDKSDLDLVHHLMAKARETKSQYTVWFGHFPTSCILSYGNETLREAIGRDENGMVYLCGHLHMLGGLVPRMYTMQNEGFLELELGDWKDNRMYRLMAIDHGLLSFIDLKHGEWPVVLITNPKHTLFFNPHRENVKSMITSTHIRLLAFSLSPITKIKIRIDSKNWQDCRNVEGPLYVLKWNPNDYLFGIHRIEVFVKDQDGREKYYEHKFSLDNSRLSFDVMAKFALQIDASTLFKCMFAVIFLISTTPLLLIRVLHKLVEKGKLPRPKIRNSCWQNWFRKLWVLSTTDCLFYPIFLYSVYLCVGPWSVGYIIEDNIGVIFAWGILVNGTFLPGSFTYAYGFIQFLTFQIPLTLIIAHGADFRLQTKVLKPEKKVSTLNYIGLQLPFIITFSIQVVMAYLFWLAYGTLGFILGPLRTWSLILALVLWYMVLTLPEKHTQKSAKIWNPKPEGEVIITNVSSQTHINYTS